MLVDDSVQIPLRARDGSVKAYVTVDKEDAEWLNQWRWCLNGFGYARRNQKRKGQPQRAVYLHRELFGLKSGDKTEVDHVDRDRLNCRRSNLRLVPRAGNMQNLPSRKGSSSQYLGVIFRARKKTNQWEAYIGIDKKYKHLGSFPTEKKAANAASEARKKFMPYYLG